MSLKQQLEKYLLRTFNNDAAAGKQETLLHRQN